MLVGVGRRGSKRGATLVEYALLIVAVMLIAALAYREMGKEVRHNADKAAETLMQR